MGRTTPTLGYFLGLLSGTVLGYSWAEGGGLVISIVGGLVAVLGCLVVLHALRSSEPMQPGGEYHERERNWDWSAAPPLGQMLVNYNLITEADLNRALDRQRKIRKRLGNTLVEMGLITYQQVADVLEEQFSRRDHSKGPPDDAD